MARRPLFENKCIWVFGGAGYLGQAVVRALVDEDAEVLCVDLGDRAEKFAKAENLALRTATCDISEVEQTKALVRDQADQYGPPHGFINLAFASTAEPLEKLSAEDFDRINHVNLTASFHLYRQVATLMAEAGGGSIVMVSSMYGNVAPDPSIYPPSLNPNPVEYGVNKAGVQQMARYFAVHFGRKGVRCNALSPGAFPHPPLQEAEPDFIRKLGNKTALGRIGRPSEIGKAAAFLLSDDASYITGQNILVDGGWSAW